MNFLPITKICEINPAKAIDLPDHSEISFVPMESVSVDGHVDLSRTIDIARVKNYSVFKDGDILFAKITPCMENGKGAIANGLKNGYGAGSTEFIVLRPNKNLVSAKWVYLFLSQTRFRFVCQQNMTGSAGQKRVPPKYLATCKIPVPPLDEQKRIVARIEELFSQLDSGVETLLKTKQQLAVYRQAVLKEAFDSVLGYDCAIEDVCKEIKVGIVIKPTQYYVESGGVRAFRNANVRRGYIDDCDWVMISQDGHQRNKKSEVHEGDVLISRSGANLGMASPVSQQYDGYNAIDVVIAVPKTDVILPAFLAHYTNSPAGRSIVKTNERGAAQGHLNISVYGRLPITIPSLANQRALVARIEEKLSFCDSIEQTVDTALKQAEAMRQSILKQAFEGEL